jgi:hypothetical protein
MKELNWDLIGLYSSIAVALLTLVVIYSSFMSGKIKDAEVKDAQSKLIATQGKLIIKSDEVIAAQKELFRFTSGEGYCIIKAIGINNENPDVVISNTGKYPIFDVHITFMRLEELDTVGTNDPNARTIDVELLGQFDGVNTLQSEQAASIGNIKISDNLKLSYLVISRNKKTYQRTVYKKGLNNKWLEAKIVTDVSQEVYSKLYEDIPKELMELYPDFKFPPIVLQEIVNPKS